MGSVWSVEIGKVAMIIYTDAFKPLQAGSANRDAIIREFVINFGISEGSFSSGNFEFFRGGACNG